MYPLAQIATRLETGGKSRDLIEKCLARIFDRSGQGSLTFLKVHSEEAIARADIFDRMRNCGDPPTRFAGIPVSIKDLFDIAGDVTMAGSVALRDATPANRDALCIARLKAAGFIVIGRTNMSEFAFSALGVNPHYGTPRNPYDRLSGRIPGGSSSGAAVSVTDEMAIVSLGTDTGGSCRIPAALCGLVGFKPTASRIPTHGAFALAPSLDSIGPLAPTVECCGILDAVLAGEPPSKLHSWPVQNLRLAVPQTLVLDELDRPVSQAFDHALTVISRMGPRIVEIPLRELAQVSEYNTNDAFDMAEAYAVHRSLIAAKENAYDPHLLVRLLRGGKQSPASYSDLLNTRADIIRRVKLITAPHDALLMPTVPIIAPRFDHINLSDAYSAPHSLLLRNPSIANFLDRCAISVPCHSKGDAPVGLMLIGERNSDRKLLSIAASIENMLSPVMQR